MSDLRLENAIKKINMAQEKIKEILKDRFILNTLISEHIFEITDIKSGDRFARLCIYPTTEGSWISARYTGDIKFWITGPKYCDRKTHFSKIESISDRVEKQLETFKKLKLAEKRHDHYLACKKDYEESVLKFLKERFANMPISFKVINSCIVETGEAGTFLGKSATVELVFPKNNPLLPGYVGFNGDKIEIEHFSIISFLGAKIDLLVFEQIIKTIYENRLDK